MIEQTKNEVIHYHHNGHASESFSPEEAAVPNEVVHYYYDSHPTEEDLMSEAAVHRVVIRYLVAVLTWLFEGRVCAIHENLGFYQTGDSTEYPLAPDVAVVQGEAFTLVRSWRVDETGPAPQVVFEIASEETWKRDLDEKPERYAAMGMQEYYAYDPYDPPLPLSRERGQRLFGWHLDESTGLLQSMPLLPDGSLWSPHLESFLVPGDTYLHLYDRSHHLRLTKAEAEAEARRIALRRAEVEAEAKRVALQLAQAEARRADMEAAARRAEARRADMEAERARILTEKLRSLGIDPEQLL